MPSGMKPIRVVFAVALASAFVAARAEITVENYDPGEVVHYPLVMIHGHSGGETISIGLDGAHMVAYPVVKGEYRALAELKPGQNMVLFRSGLDSMKFRIDYQRPTTPLHVLTVWAKAKDEGLAYRVNANGTEELRSKLDLGMKLLQCFYAEAMREAGYGRKTFPLEFDPAGHVILHVLELPKTGDEMRAMDNDSSWRYIYDQLSTQFPEDTSHWCTMLGFTEFNPATKKVTGHYALGGGRLGAFGTGSMSLWPAHLRDVIPTLENATPMAPNDFDDSGNRGTVWANVATAFGAMAHEMGHTFGLPHSNDGFSVMSRGFDFFNRTFTVEEPPRRGETGNTVVKPGQYSRWDAYSAAKLNWNPYLQSEPVASAEAPPKIEIANGEVIFTASAGIRVWGADRDDVNAYFGETKTGTPETLHKVSLAELREKMGSKFPYRITLIDSSGRQTTIEDRG